MKQAPAFRRLPAFILLILVLPLLLLAGCASTPYQEYGNKIFGGYFSKKISANAYSVTFQGNENSNSKQVHDFALLRSAELTIECGYKYFVVIKDENQPLGESDRTHSTYSFQVQESRVTPTSITTPNATQTTVKITGGRTTLIKPRYTLTIQMYGDRASIRGPSNQIYEAAPLIERLKTKHKVQ